MSVSCYISRSATTVAELMTFIEIPRLGELLRLPDEDDEFEVVSVRHSAQPPSSRSRPTVHVYLAAKPRR